MADGGDLGHRFGGLDGLRAVAVVLVIWFHYGAPPGFRSLGGFAHPAAGYLGAQLFFVISGFLITARLLAEYEVRGRVDVQRFIVRRAVRLMPPLVLCLTLLVTMNWLRGHDGADTVTATASAIGYVFNLVAFWKSTGVELGGDGWGHLWSLSLEEQFYLGWPALLGLMTRRFRLPRSPFACCVGAALLIGAWRTLLWRAGAPTLRLYLPSDVRADGVLWGAATALLRPVPRRPFTGRGGVAVVSLLVVIGCAFGGSRWDTSSSPGWMYGPGFTLFSMASAVLVAALASGDGRLVDVVMNSRLMTGVGTRSYGLYLFHEPVRSLAELRRGGYPLALAGTLALTEASLRLVERPLARRFRRRMQP